MTNDYDSGKSQLSLNGMHGWTTSVTQNIQVLLYDSMTTIESLMKTSGPNINALAIQCFIDIAINRGVSRNMD